MAKIPTLTNSSKGMSLVEVIVVLAVFLVVVDAVVSIFVTQTQQQKSMLKDQEVLNQVDYSLEYMGRVIRTATVSTNGCLEGNIMIYSLTHRDTFSPEFQGGYQGIRFFSLYDNACHEFFFDAGGTLKETKSSDPSGALNDMLSSSDFNKFSIKYVRFIINGDRFKNTVFSSDAIQPRITIAIGIATPTNKNQKERVFQTTVSKRNKSVPSGGTPPPPPPPPPSPFPPPP